MSAKKVWVVGPPLVETHESAEALAEFLYDAFGFDLSDESNAQARSVLVVPVAFGEQVSERMMVTLFDAQGNVVRSELV